MGVPLEHVPVAGKSALVELPYDIAELYTCEE